MTQRTRWRRRVQSAVRRIIRCRCLEDYTRDERRAMWPEARALTARQLSNCRVLESRERILEHLPKHAVCAELGIWRGDFSRAILAATQPARLHLVDIDEEAARHASVRFASQVRDGVVQVHRGDSADTVLSLPDAYLDW